MTTNYSSTFIAASPDSSAVRGTAPKENSVGAIQLKLLRERPYSLTSDELLFEVHAHRNNISDADRAQEQEAFAAKSRACLRASPLVKKHGWGFHHDANGRVAAFGVETDDYIRLSADSRLDQTKGMRSKRS